MPYFSHGREKGEVIRMKLKVVISSVIFVSFIRFHGGVVSGVPF